ncbi:MAG: type I DNA topoisomerase [Candidatus Vogelbacteria bacterium]|nr:type I DNA topoisomerase [Candidatus Vogelbacteria bacterium]
MKLLIVESPAKAKTISKYLNGKYKVVASVGHVRNLPKSNKNAIDIKAGFVPHYEVSKGKEHVIKEIKDLAQNAEEVLLATDPDREGEAIAWHVKEVAEIKNPKRVVFHEITERAVKEAITHPREIDQDLRMAQEARRVLDRLVGYDLSGLIWKKVRYGLSAGRVQSPALRILMEREREIRAFIPKDFWVLTAKTQTPSKEELTLECVERPEAKEIVERILSLGRKGVWKIIDVKEEKNERRSRAPFTTSTLQQSASSRLGFSPSRTMSIAQKLYENGFITYMRTDSTNLSKDAIDEIKSAVTKNFGGGLFLKQSYKSKIKNAQEAHEAIRPTHALSAIAGKTDDETKLYRLIWSRTVASQMVPAIILKTKVVANITEGVIPDFQANGSRILFPGWLLADKVARGEDVEIPKVSQADTLNLISMDSEEKATEPPNRYTEAGLIKELEKRGIGRPSTYASIIQTIQTRGYVDKENKALKPTDTGDIVSTFLENNFSNYISDNFTAEMEENLDKIANGEKEYVKVLKDFYGPFQKDVKSKNDIDKITNLGAAPEEMVCPKCGEEMIIKLGRSGKFFSCSKFPDCSGARTMEGRETEGPKETGETCPKCDTGKLVERGGKFGKFISCNRYPKCKFIKEDEEAKKAKDTGVFCPICKKGTMVEKRGRFGTFYSCSAYPECKHIIKSKPTGKICGYMRESGPCPHLMMEGTKTIPERCSNKTCPNHNPQKTKK